MDLFDKKVKTKVKSVLTKIRDNKGSPIVKDFGHPISADFLHKQFISFCSLWKYYLVLAEMAEEFEVCQEIIEIVDLQKKFMIELKNYEKIIDDGFEDGLDFIESVMIKA